MAMFITQDTFDEVVKENMEDFGMDRQSAAEDAIGQFKAQGGMQTASLEIALGTAVHKQVGYP